MVGRHEMDKEHIDRLIRGVLFFANSPDNQVWPTPQRWTLKEAKQALYELAKDARQAIS